MSHDKQDGHEPLMAAAASGALDELRELATRGVDLNQALDNHGNTAAEVAARAKRWDFVLEVAVLGGDLSKHGLMSCLAWAVSSAPEMCAALLQGGCPHSEADGSSQALRSAAESNNTEAVDQLLEAGAQIDASDAKGRTPLSSAARMGHLPMVTYLLQRGASPDGAPGDNAPLLLAQKHKRVDCLVALLDAKASLDVRDAKGLTGLERAKKAYQNDVVALWEKAMRPAPKGPVPTHLLPAPRAQRPSDTFESLETLLQHWGSVERLEPPSPGAPATYRVTNGPWTAWVHGGFAQSFDCTLALEFYGVDPEASWPFETFQELLADASRQWREARAAAKGAAPPSLALLLAKPELELRFHCMGAPSQVFSEQDWGRALADHRPDAFGGKFQLDGAEKSIVALQALTLGEWIFRQEGLSVAQIREVHEALDRDILASPHWRNAWHGEAGGELSDWLSRQAMIRERFNVGDGSLA